MTAVLWLMSYTALSVVTGYRRGATEGATQAMTSYCLCTCHQLLLQHKPNCVRRAYTRTRMMAVLWLMLYTALSLRVVTGYRRGAAVGMTMAIQARKSSEQEALLMVALNSWLLNLKPPMRKQQPA